MIVQSLSTSSFVPVGSGGPLILPERYRPKVLMDVPRSEWRSPSRALPKDQFGRENQTRFRITGRLDDGHVKFRLWFDDRDAFDSFLHDALIAQIEQTPFPRENWSLVDEVWGDPSLWQETRLAVDTVTFLTGSAGSDLTYTSPSDWDSAHNSAETIGGGASGGAYNGVGHATGGGGGAWNKTTNISFASPGTTTASYRIAAGVSGVAANHAGNNGNDTWFSGASLGASSVGSKGGVAGDAGAGSRSGGAGGLGSSGVGSSSHDGGRGGNLTSGSGSARGGSGGGGAAGAAANGSNGVDSDAGGNIVTDGGAGNGGLGGAGGGGSLAASPNTGGAGGNGAEWDASHGSGGGGGGAEASGTQTGGVGGNYGGAGAGALSSTSGATSGAGAQGIIVVTYTPAVAASGGMMMMFN